MLLSGPIAIAYGEWGTSTSAPFSGFPPRSAAQPATEIATIAATIERIAKRAGRLVTPSNPARLISAHDLRGSQSRDLALRKAKVGEDLIRLLAELRRVAPQLRLGPRETRGRSYRTHLPRLG